MPKIVKPLTDIKVANAKPEDKEYILTDGQGLYLRVRPGGTKSWVYSFKCPKTGKKQKITIGRYRSSGSSVSLSQARLKRAEFQIQIQSGLNPKIEIEKARLTGEGTFGEIAVRWLEVRSSEVGADTLTDIRRRLEIHIFPYLGTYPISEITPPVVINCLKRLEQANKLDTVSRICSYLNQIMTFSINNGIIDFHNLHGIRKAFKTAKVKAQPSVRADELSRVIKSILESQCELTTKGAALVLMHSLLRPGEVAPAKWSEINFEKKLWTVPWQRIKTWNSSDGDHVIPLTDELLAVFAKLKTFNGDREYIFFSPRARTGHMSSQTINMALKRLGYKGKIVSHGFRSTGSTFLNEDQSNFDGISADIIEAALTHKISGVRGRYNRGRYLESRRVVMELWSRKLVSMYSYF